VIGEIPQLIPSFTLLTLTTLEINTSLYLLHYIHAPGLQSLTLCSQVGEISNLESLHALVVRSGPPLHTLRLTRVDIPEILFIQCLEALPLLETLQLHECIASDAVLNALVTSPSAEDRAGWLLPRLKRIDLASNYHITASGFIEFIASRNGPSSTSATGARPPRIEGAVSFVQQQSRNEYEAIQSYGNFITKMKFSEEPAA